MVLKCLWFWNKGMLTEKLSGQDWREARAHVSQLNVLDYLALLIGLTVGCACAYTWQITVRSESILIILLLWTICAEIAVHLLHEAEV